MSTAMMIEQISHDENIMKEVLSKAEEHITKNEVDAAEKYYIDGYQYENWREKFGPQMLVGIAYCQLKKDIAKAEETLK